MAFVGAGVVSLCCHKKKKCKKALVLSQSPLSPPLALNPNSASITFNQKVVVASFTVSVAGGEPFGNVAGSFVYDAGTRTATFTAAPPIVDGGGGTATVTVVIDQGTKCEQTIVWTFDIEAA